MTRGHVILAAVLLLTILVLALCAVPLHQTIAIATLAAAAVEVLSRMRKPAPELVVNSRDATPPGCAVFHGPTGEPVTSIVLMGPDGGVRAPDERGVLVMNEDQDGWAWAVFDRTDSRLLMTWTQPRTRGGFIHVEVNR